MKLGLLALALAPCRASGGRTATAASHRVFDIEAAQDPAVHPDAARDIAACTQVAKQFIKTPAIRAVVLEHAESFCGESKQFAKIACSHFHEAVESALPKQEDQTKYDAQAFCEATENYMLDLRGATRVPNMGSGPLQDFKLSPQCVSVVSSTIKPMARIPTSKVPDFWYAMCMNQNCAHFLPSRTKWCNEKLTPTHSVNVCRALRKFAVDEAAVHEAGALEPKQICDLYGEFVREMGIDVDSYEHIIHSDSPKRLSFAAVRHMDNVDPPPSQVGPRFRSGSPRAHGMCYVIVLVLPLATAVLALAME